VKEVTKEDFETEVIQSGTPVVVDFWGPQCRPCLALMPAVERLEQENDGAIKIVKVEAPKNRRLCLQLQVLSLPTFLFYKDGQEVDRLAGGVTAVQIKESIKKLVGQTAD
jgi:thioredoxin 1